jgi:hypothetical protein
VDHRRVVLQFVVVLVIDDNALAVAAGGECSQNIDSRSCGHRELAVALTKILEVGLIDEFRAEDLGVA